MQWSRHYHLTQQELIIEPQTLFRAGRDKRPAQLKKGLATRDYLVLCPAYWYVRTM